MWNTECIVFHMLIQVRTLHKVYNMFNNHQQLINYQSWFVVELLYVEFFISILLDYRVSCLNFSLSSYSLCLLSVILTIIYMCIVHVYMTCCVHWGLLDFRILYLGLNLHYCGGIRYRVQYMKVIDYFFFSTQYITSRQLPGLDICSKK